MNLIHGKRAYIKRGLLFAFNLLLACFWLAAAPRVMAGEPSSGLLVPDGLELGEMSYYDALEILKKNVEQRKRDFSVTVEIDDRTYGIIAEDINWDSDAAEVLSALIAGQAHPDGKKLETRHDIFGFTYDEAKLDRIIAEIYEDFVGCPPSGIVPKFDFETREFIFHPDFTGVTIDLEALKAELIKALEKQAHGMTDALIRLEPLEYTDVAKLGESYGLLGTYTTYTTNVANRNANIRLACETLSGTTVSSGEVFSYLGIIGNANAEKGYKIAGILVNGKAAQGYGGGICQVSSTMYNSVLEAGLKVVERWPHSSQVNYVPRGRDATVSYPNVDFKFENNTDDALYLMADYDNYALTISLYGKKAPREAPGEIASVGQG
ncbi:MAG: VanW family protein [Clostridiales bacterium]|jgi:hypothetical protein|nr:VanW family protein [Clostridiales bacterium]